jgi:signal recognition particle subunit SRP54
MFDQLSERLQDTLASLSGNKQLTLENIDEALKEVRRALLEADVSLRVVKAFITRVKERAEGEGVLKSVTPSQQLVKIVHDELAALLGGENKPLNLDGKPTIIMMFGLQGSGKTTTCGKLALQLRKKGRQPLLVAADVYRPAAIQQLVSLGKQVGIPVFTIDGSTNVLDIARGAMEHAAENNLNIVIIDTAGRLQVDTDMMAELLLLERSFKPDEKLLVIDAMTGQEAIHVAETFNTQLDITGIVLTKLDGDTRGGAALSVVEVTGKPIKLVGTGEKMDGLEPFYPDRMATRILGMGDVVSLVEKAQEAIDLDEAKELERKMRKQEFSLEDFMKIQKTMKRLGSLDQILGMLPIPGLNREMREMLAHGGEEQLRRVESIINSMTLLERQKPDQINKSRKVRIAKGCGLQEADISKFLKDFDMMRKMMKQMTQMTDGHKKGKRPNMPNVPNMGGMPKVHKGGKFPRLPGGKNPPFPF